MSTRNSDINLIIRAKTEGEKAICSMADALNHLRDDAGAGSSTLAEFVKTLGALDKAAAGLATTQDKVGTSATKQADAIHAASAGIAEQKARIADLQRGVGILSPEQDKAFVGPRRNGRESCRRSQKASFATPSGSWRASRTASIAIWPRFKHRDQASWI